jgi:hypothetical protein
MIVATKHYFLLKFKLKVTRIHVSKFEPIEFITYMKLIKDQKGNFLGMVQQEAKLNLKERSIFKGNFCYTSQHILQFFDLAECFLDFLYALLEHYEEYNPINDSDDNKPAGYTCGEPQCVLFNDNI